MSGVHRGDTQLQLPRTVVVRLVVLGSALGVAARFVDAFAPKWIGNLGAVWFLSGFLAGRLVSRPRLGTAMGALCLAVSNVAYYTLRLVVDPISLGDLVPIPLGWLVVGVFTGAAAGWLGARSHRFPEAWGAPAGVFVGEAIAIIVLRQRVAQAVIECGCAFVCLRLAGGAWKRGAALAVVACPYVAGFAALYRAALW